jgi:UPF0755 protein
MNSSKHYLFMWGGIVVVCIIFVYVCVQFFSISKNFPHNKNFVINENESLKSISYRLHDEGYITSPVLFRAGISFLGKDKIIQLGGYTFDIPRSLFGVVKTFVGGHPTSPLLSVTIPEGSKTVDIAKLVSKVLPSVSVDSFTKAVLTYHAEGKLFPSTYFLVPSYDADDVVKMMMSTYSKKIPALTKETIPSPLTNENEVLSLAAILEGEVRTEEDMKMVAGILLSRLVKKMPLQVDAAKVTYKEKGLPTIPINNPGLIAIDAVLHPTPSPYLFYITGDDDVTHYAKTFEEHRKNIIRYLGGK